ncbi:MAG: Fic family protein [Coriobacteriales bacterium]|nr:Fic family protein [Coriobacteriales bacterium]
MRSFHYSDAVTGDRSAAVSELLEAIARDKRRFLELRGEQPALLLELERKALVDNCDASARIEGIYLFPERVEELLTSADVVLSSASEQQVVGYGKILKAMVKSPDFFSVSPSTFLAMHTVLFSDQVMNSRSRYRRKDYQDVMDGRGQIQRIAVSPIHAFETPLYLGSLCDDLATAFASDGDDRLLMIPRMVVDIMCIKPFDRGTGRLARLMAQKLMGDCGVGIARYVSVDRLCERSGMDYYAALNACAEGWDSGSNDYEPFTVYWLGKVHEAYQELLPRLEIRNQEAGGKTSKTDRVRSYFQLHDGPVTKRMIAQDNPDISISTIENALRELLHEGSIIMLRSGRSASYQRVDGPPC